jgi:hypothetical protein
MKPGVNLLITTARFDEALRDFQAHSRRGAKENLMAQGRLLVMDFMKITPPNKRFEWNKQGGEKTVRNDLAKLFRASSARSAEGNLAAIHQKSRNRRGRISKNTLQIKARGLVQYRKQVLAKVGQLAAGWKKAAMSLAARGVPAWISRHNRPGLGKVSVRSGRVELEIANKGVYSGLKNWIDRGVIASQRKRYWAMVKRVNYSQKKAAQKAGMTAKG